MFIWEHMKAIKFNPHLNEKISISGNDLHVCVLLTSDPAFLHLYLCINYTNKILFESRAKNLSGGLLVYYPCRNNKLFQCSFILVIE